MHLGSAFLKGHGTLAVGSHQNWQRLPVGLFSTYGLGSNRPVVSMDPQKASILGPFLFFEGGVDDKST